MQRKLVTLALVVACCSAIPINSLKKYSAEELALFNKFKQEYKKFYFDEHDDLYRLSVFVENVKMIREHNSAANNSYTLAMNEFGDLTFQEFHARYTGFGGVRNEYLRSRNMAALPSDNLPDSVDWQAAGAVTPVKNQGSCGSCWAFSTTGSIESANFIAHQTLISLSEQELMDCSGPEGTYSCSGGWMDEAFQYVILNGLCSEATYPYHAVDEACHNTTCTKVVAMTGFRDVAQSEDALKAAVAQQPVCVTIEADQPAFQFYHSGVLSAGCGKNLDHAVLAVGYGNLNGVDYWKVKNSWGSTWGMKGYVLIERGVDECGIHDAASYPIVA